MKIRLLFIITLFMCPFVAHSQIINDSPKEAAFKNGEKLSFIIQHSYVNSDIVEVTFQTSHTKVGDTAAYRIWANGKTMSNYKFLFDLDDTYETWLDHSDLRPLMFRNRLKEGKYRYRSEYTYHWDEMKLHTSSQNLKRSDEPRLRVLDLTPESADAVAFFFNLRSSDVAAMKPGEVRGFDFVMADEIKRLNYHVTGREEKKIGKLGTFRTIRIVCQLTSGEDDPDAQTFEDGTEFTLWITDDKNHLPLLLESPIKFGRIVASLRGYEGLKYPLESKIK